MDDLGEKSEVYSPLSPRVVVFDALLADLESTTSHLSKRPAFLQEDPYTVPTAYPGDGGAPHAAFGNSYAQRARPGDDVPPPIPPPPSLQALNGGGDSDDFHPRPPPPPAYVPSYNNQVADSKGQARPGAPGAPRVVAASGDHEHIYSLPNKPKSAEPSPSYTSSFGLGSNLSELDRILQELNCDQYSLPGNDVVAPTGPVAGGHDADFPRKEGGAAMLVLPGGPGGAPLAGGAAGDKGLGPAGAAGGGRGVQPQARPSVESLLGELKGSGPPADPSRTAVTAHPVSQPSMKLSAAAGHGTASHAAPSLQQQHQQQQLAQQQQQQHQQLAQQQQQQPAMNMATGQGGAIPNRLPPGGGGGGGGGAPLLQQQQQPGGQWEGPAAGAGQPQMLGAPLPQPQQARISASSATRELDELMACLSDFKLQSNIPGQAGGVIQNKGGAQTGDQLDSMLGSLQFDLNRQGVATLAKGQCAACNKPIAGQVVTAMGRTWHPEHFVCTECQEEIGARNFFERDGLPYCEKDYHFLFSPRCAYCSGPILDKVVTALDKTWHPEHFFCVQCGHFFGDEGFHEKDGKPYCRQDYFEMFAPKCGGCSRAIVENYISALSALWHPECFVCRECFTPFINGSFFEHEGQPYCEVHYHERRGSLCSGCQKPITGRCITAMAKKFHPEHFVCAFCLKQLNKGTFKEQNDKPYCHPCFIKLFG
ncbi:LOW QUALITY PROTEIN: paxillin-like [Lampetra planeri]